MGHCVRLFIGPLVALRGLAAAAPAHARAHAIEASERFPVLPLTEDLHEAWHAAYGTGDWLALGPMLTSTDLAHAERASRGSALAYVETDYFGGRGRQCAVLWRDGALVLKPAALASDEGRALPPALRPINAALRGLGITAAPGLDEFDTLGLARWRSNEAILERGRPLRL